MADTLLPITQSPLNKARKDKFRLVLTIPNILKNLQNRNSREESYLNLDSLQFSVYSINVPSIEVTPVNLHYAGQNHNITSFDRPQYEKASVNYVIDNEFKNYWVMWKWLQLLNDPLESTYGRPTIFKETGGYPTINPVNLHDYSTTINIISLDEYNKNKMQFIFTYAFPTRLGNFSYDFRDPEEINCSFEFVFNQLNIELL